MAIRGAAATASRVPAPVARRLFEASAVAISHQPHRPGAPSGWATRREMVGRHLRRVLGYDPGRIRTRRLVDQAIASYGRYWAESLRLPSLDPERLAAGITYDGFEHVDAARASGWGAIVALPHLGGWEWAGTHLARSGYPVSVVVERLRPDDLFEWFVAFREQLGMQVIPAGPGAAARCAAALADNHILCLLSDRVVGGTSGVDVEFFGEKTQLPAGPATLALRTGATLLPAAVYFSEPTDAHRGVVRPPLDTSRHDGLRADVGRVTASLAAAFEELIRPAPTQWHLLQPNWPSDRAPTGLK